MSTASPARSFDASAPSPWDRSPSAGGTQRQLAQSHGSVVDPVLHNPHFPHPDPVSGALLVDPDTLLKAKGFEHARSTSTGATRSVATTNVSQDPPTLAVTTMVWDASDYLLLNEPA